MIVSSYDMQRTAFAPAQNKSTRKGLIIKVLFDYFACLDNVTNIFNGYTAFKHTLDHMHSKGKFVRHVFP